MNSLSICAFACKNDFVLEHLVTIPRRPWDGKLLDVEKNLHNAFKFCNLSMALSISCWNSICLFVCMFKDDIFIVNFVDRSNIIIAAWNVSPLVKFSDVITVDANPDRVKVFVHTKNCRA